MQQRVTSWALMALFGGALAFVPVNQAGQEVEGNSLKNIPVQGTVCHDGSFVGNVTIASLVFYEDDTLFVTGVLGGTVIDKAGVSTRIATQPFRIPARLVDSGQTTAVIVLDMASICIDSLGLQVKLTYITVDIYAIPSDEDPLTVPLHRLPIAREQWTSSTVDR